MKGKILALVVLFLAVVIEMFLFSGCSSCGKKNPMDTVPELTKTDTTEVIKLTEEYLEHVKNKEYDEAIAMLHEFTLKEINQLSPEKDSIIRIQQKMFPVIDYELTDMKFENSRKVRITYAVEFFEKDPDDKIPNTIKLTFAPQRIAHVWYLALVERSHVR